MKTHTLFIALAAAIFGVGAVGFLNASKPAAVSDASVVEAERNSIYLKLIMLSREVAAQQLSDPSSATFKNERIIFGHNKRPVAVCGEMYHANAFGVRRHTRYINSFEAEKVYLIDTEGSSSVGKGQWNEHCA